MPELSAASRNGGHHPARRSRWRCLLCPEQGPGGLYSYELHYARHHCPTHRPGTAHLGLPPQHIDTATREALR